MLLAFVFLLFKFSLASAENCPAGGVFESTFNKCYIYYDQPAVFLEAESTCRSIGANLAEIRNELVITLKHDATSSAYWIGANLLLSPRWTWTTNESTLYTNWAADQPPDPSNSDCASVTTDGTNLWKKALCYSALSFVCTVTPTSAPVTAPPNNSPCDPGYIHYEDQCFKLFTGIVNRLNYYAADQFCREQNATLPKITSLGLQNFVVGLIFDEQVDIWLGLTCYGTNGISSCWWWDYSHPTYTNYWPGNPQGPYPVSLMVANGLWQSNCDFRPLVNAAVCQKPARNVTMNYV